MKLLLDENLSLRLVQVLASEFPGTTHVESLGRRGATDREIWELARTQGYVLVSKDNDFRQLSFLFGPPPKVILLSVGNLGTDGIVTTLKANRSRIADFVGKVEEGFLIIKPRR